jgi:DNA-binding SARP family transcriptional activator
MLRLKTFGGLAVRNEHGPLYGAAVRRRPLALLALVAGAGSDGVSRDKVVAYLWPESDTAHARNSLKQTLFALRHGLPGSLFDPGGTTLRLDPHAVAVDRWEFDRALEGGALRDAVELYKGPFLDGFYLERGLAFEHWVEAERRRLANRYQGALERLAACAEAAGDREAAVGWWQRLAEHDPFSCRIALGLMEALVAVGDRASALHYAVRHERLLREELDTSPDTRERAYVQQLGKRAGVSALCAISAFSGHVIGLG